MPAMAPHSRVSAPDIERRALEETLPKILNDLYALVAQQGGRISGEHGIGASAVVYVHRRFRDILMCCGVGVGPNNIMNPGKIFTV